MQCLCRAYYGSYTRAAAEMVKCGVRQWRIGVEVTLRSFWYRHVLRLTEQEEKSRW